MKRQIILIMTDSQRKDMLGCYGYTDMITPHLDSLAEDGIRFEKAYTTQPVCGPARSAIFTGLYPHSNGSFSNCIALESTVKTIGERLTHEQIRTAYIGKWHLDGGDYFGTGKCPKGWDEKCIEFGRYEVSHDYFGGFQPYRAVFDGRYKLAVHLLSEDELYDLKIDPQEMNNLIEDETSAAVRDVLHDKLLSWMNETKGSRL